LAAGFKKKYLLNFLLCGKHIWKPIGHFLFTCESVLWFCGTLCSLFGRFRIGELVKQSQSDHFFEKDGDEDKGSERLSVNSWMMDWGPSKYDFLVIPSGDGSNTSVIYIYRKKPTRNRIEALLTDCEWDHRTVLLGLSNSGLSATFKWQTFLHASQFYWSISFDSPTAISCPQKRIYSPSSATAVYCSGESLMQGCDLSCLSFRSYLLGKKNWLWRNSESYMEIIRIDYPTLWLQNTHLPPTMQLCFRTLELRIEAGLCETAKKWFALARPQKRNLRIWKCPAMNWE